MSQHFLWILVIRFFTPIKCNFRSKDEEKFVVSETDVSPETRKDRSQTSWFATTEWTLLGTREVKRCHGDGGTTSEYSRWTGNILDLNVGDHMTIQDLFYKFLDGLWRNHMTQICRKNIPKFNVSSSERFVKDQNEQKDLLLLFDKEYYLYRRSFVTLTLFL